ncbi:type II secretion system minor pseudopilin GspK [Xylophilus ampelinus]|uniref:General secretion pathway protein K n=1 Tax=Xylophilus ampelinus TaxID=54067 RepID=A0A318SJ15_9BURK|nr:type II secretion system minor pseudopilin GspK [Xylophilus ampelinus]MCS4511022.1 type II secretion system minor pseudopilin GspK [Xylophilus ampelinus]PYE75984.1 general secretion pathway protein K [Xylophilus ampelinus]
MRPRHAAAQRGAALLAAMLTVTLVATFAAAAMWQQWRSTEIETAERARMQAAWILVGALDWSRLILREDGNANLRNPSGPADHLGEPWALPLQEARLSSFLAAADRSGAGAEASDDVRDAFLSGQILDMQGRLNLRNLIDTNGRISASWRAAFQKLFAQLGLPVQELDRIAEGMRQALAGSAATAGSNMPGTNTGTTTSSTGTTTGTTGTGATAATGTVDPDAPLLPQRLEQFAWFGVSLGTLQALAPYATMLPETTPVNVNTADALVIAAALPEIDASSAQRLVASRAGNYLRDGENIRKALQMETVPDPAVVAVASRYFEVRGRLRLDNAVVEERSLVQRDGNAVATVWRERGAIGVAQALQAAQEAAAR